MLIPILELEVWRSAPVVAAEATRTRERFARTGECSPAASVTDAAVSSSQRDGLRLVVEHTAPAEVFEVAAFLTEGLRGGK